ncbi:amino acid transport protein [Naegleria gruberi]|uniref:Amino acid transport protein n=1 Tax=Naegleria gruberi TaxID=5762 RepID=D2V0J6_NAEGR|nr:amino acid transport protein [Naegleria gruberi]EFC49532.1 amino acid transport protein [Naegleria gruberi]|eukprot:XP_002682276.1 amino acid transport protein [Naegleria gruberi strain NEG-M]
MNDNSAYYLSSETPIMNPPFLLSSNQEDPSLLSINNVGYGGVGDLNESTDHLLGSNEVVDNQQQQLNHDDLNNEHEVIIKKQLPSKTNSFSTFLNLTKTFAGASTFALPWSFKQSGLLTGVLIVLFLAILSNYTMKLLIKCRRYIQSQEEYKESSEYWKIRPVRLPISHKKELNDEGKLINLPIYPKKHSPPKTIDENGEIITTIEKSIDPNDYIYEQDRIITYIDIGYEAMGNFGSILVYVLMVMCNVGVGTIYLVLMAGCLNGMVPEVPLRVWMLFFIPLFIVLSWIRSYKYLAPLTMIGTIALLLALGSVLVYGFIYQRHNMKWPWEYAHVAWIEPSTLPLCIGNVMFLFCTHTMMLSIEQSMKTRKRYYTTLNFSFIFVVIVNLTFGLLVFEFFPYNIEQSATENLPQNSIFVYIIQSCLCLEVILTYTVVLMPVGELFDEKILQKLLEKLKRFVKNQKFSKFLYFLLSVLFRSLIVVITVGLAEVFGDRFGVVMSFIGALSPNPLAFVLPPLFYLIIMRKTISLPTFILNAFIIVFGVLTMVWNTYSSIMSIINEK